jgi:hypothetical protein
MTSNLPPSSFQIGDIASWIGTAIALAAALLGWRTAVNAGRRAKASNAIAEKANGIAERALSRVEDANGIAEHANKISEEANDLVQKSAAQQAELWTVDWAPKWNRDSALVVLRNTGADVAYQLNVTLDGEKLHRIDDLGDVRDGHEVTLNVHEIIQVRADHDANAERQMERNRTSSIAIIPGPLQYRLKLSLKWKTGLGQQQNETINLTIH